MGSERNFRSHYYEKMGFRGVEEKKSLDILLCEKPIDRDRIHNFCLRWTMSAGHTSRWHYFPGSPCPASTGTRSGSCCWACCPSTPKTPSLFGARGRSSSKSRRGHCASLRRSLQPRPPASRSPWSGCSRETAWRWVRVRLSDISYLKLWLGLRPFDGDI